MGIKKNGGWYIQLFLSAVFVILIALPLINPLLPLSEQAGITEKRRLAPKPLLTFKSLEMFPELFDQYYNDYFPFRNTLIRCNSIFKINYLKISPLPYKVIIGKDNWLFYADEGALDNYRRANLFSPQELEKIRRTVEERNQWLSSRGIAYYLVLAPEKQTIYPEFMPDSIKRKPGLSKLEQVVGYLRGHSKIKIVDAEEDLDAQKLQGQIIFRKLDTHWNQYGSFIVSNSLLELIAKDFPVIYPPKITDFSITPETILRGDLADMLALSGGAWSEEVPRFTPKDNKGQSDLFRANQQLPFKTELVVVKTTKDATLPRMLMFRDSFATPLIPFISSYFSRSVYVWAVRVWSFSLNTKLVEKEKPDLVIDEFSERYLNKLIMYDSL